MHYLTKKLIENPEILEGIEAAIQTRLRLEKYGTSGASRESIAEEIEAVKEYKKMFNL